MLLYQIIQNENFVPKQVDVNKQTAIVDIKKGDTYVSKEFNLHTLPLTISNTGIILNQEYTLKDVSHLESKLDKAMDYLEISSLEQVVIKIKYVVINYQIRKVYVFNYDNTYIDLIMLNHVLINFENNVIHKNDIVKGIGNVYGKSNNSYDLNDYGNELELNLFNNEEVNMYESMTFNKAINGTYYVEDIPCPDVLYQTVGEELKLKKDIIYKSKDANPIKWVTNTLDTKYYGLYELIKLPFNTRGFRTYIEDSKLKTDAIDFTGNVINTGDYYNSILYTLLLRQRDNYYV